MNKFIIPLLVLFTSSFAIAGEIQVNNSKNITYTKQHTEHWDKNRGRVLYLIIRIENSKPRQ